MYFGGCIIVVQMVVVVVYACSIYWELNVCVRDIMLAVCVLVILYECVCVIVRSCYVETKQLIVIDYLRRYVWYVSALPGHGG